MPVRFITVEKKTLMHYFSKVFQYEFEFMGSIVKALVLFQLVCLCFVFGCAKKSTSPTASNNVDQNLEKVRGYKSPWTRSELVLQSKDLLENCSSKLNVGFSKEVSWQTDDLCKIGSSFNNGNLTNFLVTKIESGLAFEVRINFKINDAIDDVRSQQMILDTQKCFSETQDFYQDFGINLTLKTNSSRKEKIEKAHYEIEIFDEVGQSSHLKYYYKGYADYCKTVRHEVGHLLGFPDEYSSSLTCPDRKVYDYNSPFNIMSNPFGSRAETALFPWNIKQLLKPVCFTEINAKAIELNSKSKIDLSQYRQVGEMSSTLIFQGGKMVTRSEQVRSVLPYCEVTFFSWKPDSLSLVVEAGDKFDIRYSEHLYSAYLKHTLIYSNDDAVSDKPFLSRINCRGDLLGQEIMKEIFGDSFSIQYLDRQIN